MDAVLAKIRSLHDGIFQHLSQLSSVDFSHIENVVNTTLCQTNGQYKSKALLDTFDRYKSKLTTSDAFAAFRALVLLKILYNNLSNPPNIRLPQGLKAETDKNVLRLIEWAQHPETWDKFVADVYWKDLAIAGGALVPLRGGVLHLAAGLGLRQAISSNILSSVRYCLFLLRHGKKPYYEIHTHLPLVSEFNQQNWELNYKDISELLTAHSDVKGVFRASWFLDPQLANISPNLSYLRTFPLANGAGLFYVGEDHSNSAFARSQTRKKLQQEGKYTPYTYLLIWHRNSLLRFFNEK